MKPLSQHITESFERGDGKIFIIDKKSREYLGAFTNKSDAKKAQKDSISPEDEEIVTGVKSDFVIKPDGKKYYTK